MSLQNWTPHNVRVLSKNGVDYDPKTRKYILTGQAIVLADLPSSGVLSANFGDVEDSNIGDIPVIKRIPAGVDPLPDGDDFLIVSSVYAQAAKAAGMDTTRLLTVGDTVFQDGKPVGCLCLVRV